MSKHTAPGPSGIYGFRNLYNFAKRSLGFTSNSESTLDWDTTDHDGEDDDDDHHDGADPGSPI